MIGTERAETILLADDEAQIIDIICVLLRSKGYQVITAANGQEALETFTKSPTAFELLVTDIAMPVLDGVASYKEMKKINPALKVIFMTGFPENMPDHVNIIQKPFHPVQLLQMIRAVLDGKVLDR